MITRLTNEGDYFGLALEPETVEDALFLINIAQNGKQSRNISHSLYRYPKTLEMWMRIGKYINKESIITRKNLKQ